MNNLERKITSVTLVVVLVISQIFILSGCNKSGDSKDAISRADWIVNLATATGTVEPESTSKSSYSDVDPSMKSFNFIQASTEWNVLDGKGKFKPNDAATYEFVAQTCLKTIGIDKLKTSNLDLKDLKDSDLVDVFSKYVSEISDPDKKVTKAKADEILEKFIEFSNELTYKPVYDIQYKEAVNTNIKSEDVTIVSESSAIVNNASSLKVGDIVVVNPSKSNPDGKALKIQKIDGNAVTYSQADIKEVCSSIKLQGSYDANILSVTGTGDTEVTATSYDPSTGNFNVEFSNAFITSAAPSVKSTGVEVKEDSNGSTATLSKGPVTATFSVDKIKIEPDLDMSFFGGVKSASCKVKMKSSITGELKGEASSKDIKLFTIKTQIGATPFTSNIDVRASVGIDGELTVSCVSSMTAEASYKKGAKPRLALTPKTELNVDGYVNAYLNVTPTVSVMLIKENLINVSATVGANALATVSGDLLDTKDPTCINILMYVSGKLGVNQKASWTSDLLNATKTIWNQDNSPVKFEKHYEFNVTKGTYGVVDSCTKGNSEEVDIPKIADNNADAVEEYFKDFTPLEDGGNLSVDFATCQLKIGETKKITVSDLPTTYSDADLVYKSNNDKIAKVGADGTITAVSSGAAVVTASTKDGKYNATVKVSVETNYAEFNGLAIKPYENLLLGA